jgi:hypothetical protein
MRTVNEIEPGKAFGILYQGDEFVVHDVNLDPHDRALTSHDRELIFTLKALNRGDLSRHWHDEQAVRSRGI